ncbi:protein kinase [Heterostelium album PN500]|uniref:Protein kinase n=1 Tax=Heterostelium pallidum (strain ATCC 26659 / Pp 5 / PN500) TaxID=670386 RepID=D3BR24_HETP5|nr:protein kinase [Heterostelium album PN500]EFA75856.1 protein kinase [Heterostelium album PN500]|eukprot:XP_020427990.1 protein kinase [Heterostelium album PN500]
MSTFRLNFIIYTNSYPNPILLDSVHVEQLIIFIWINQYYLTGKNTWKMGTSSSKELQQQESSNATTGTVSSGTLSDVGGGGSSSVVTGSPPSTVSVIGHRRQGSFAKQEKQQKTSKKKNQRQLSSNSTSTSTCSSNSNSRRPSSSFDKSQSHSSSSIDTNLGESNTNDFIDNNNNNNIYEYNQNNNSITNSNSNSQSQLMQLQSMNDRSSTLSNQEYTNSTSTSLINTPNECQTPRTPNSLVAGKDNHHINSNSNSNNNNNNDNLSSSISSTSNSLSSMILHNDSSSSLRDHQIIICEHCHQISTSRPSSAFRPSSAMSNSIDFNINNISSSINNNNNNNNININRSRTNSTNRHNLSNSSYNPPTTTSAASNIINSNNNINNNSNNSHFSFNNSVNSTATFGYDSDDGLRNINQLTISNNSINHFSFADDDNNNTRISSSSASSSSQHHQQQHQQQQPQSNSNNNNNNQLKSIITSNPPSLNNSFSNFNNLPMPNTNNIPLSISSPSIITPTTNRLSNGLQLTPFPPSTFNNNNSNNQDNLSTTSILHSSIGSTSELFNKSLISSFLNSNNQQQQQLQLQQLQQQQAVSHQQHITTQQQLQQQQSSSSSQPMYNSSISPPTTPRHYAPRDLSYDTKDIFTITVSNSEQNSMISDNSIGSIGSGFQRLTVSSSSHRSGGIKLNDHNMHNNTSSGSNDSLFFGAQKKEAVSDYTKDITFLHSEHDSVKEKSNLSTTSSSSSSNNNNNGNSHNHNRNHLSVSQQRPRGRSISDSLFMSSNSAKDCINDIQKALENEKIKKNRFNELKEILNDRNDIIEINDIQFVQKVGEGAFSEVWEGWWKGIHVAIFRDERTDWYLGGDTCATIYAGGPTPSKLTCSVDGSIMHITEIIMILDTTRNNGNTTETDNLYFPYLTELYIGPANPPSNINNNYNILDLLDNQNNKKLSSLRLLYDFHIPNSQMKFLNTSNQIDIQFRKNPCVLQIAPIIYPKLQHIETNCQFVNNETSNVFDFNEIQFPSLTSLLMYDGESDRVVKYSASPVQGIVSMDGGPKRNRLLDLDRAVILRFFHSTNNMYRTLTNIDKYTRNLKKFARLGFVVFDNSVLPTDVIPLETLTISNNPYVSTFPPEEWLISNRDDPYMKISLDVRNTSVSGQIPEYSSISFFKIDMMYNPLITGRIPDSFCTAQQLYLRNTSLTTLPDCLLCLNGSYPNFVQLPTSIIPQKGFICEPNLEKKFFVLDISSKIIPLSGKMLGYLDSGDFSPSQLQIVRANTLFTYQTSTPSGSQTIVFSSKRKISFDIEWVTDTTILSYINHVYSLDSITFYIEGTFNVSGKNLITINNDFTFNASFGNSSFIQCTMPLPTPLSTNKDFVVTLQSNYLTFEKIVNVKAYPLVSSYSQLNSTGGSLKVTGYFGSLGVGTILIGGKECLGTPKNSSYWQCDIEPIKSGLLDVKIKMKNFDFDMPQIFVESLDKPIDCGPNDRCNGNGQCINTKCVCSTGFYGSYCESRLYEGGQINFNHTTPVTSIVANGYDFNFNMVGVQELDPSGAIIKELITTKWNSTTYNLDEVTYLNYTIQTESKVNILALIQHSNKSRDLTFANQQFTIPPNGLKLSVDINGWVYSSNLNTLRVVFNTKIEEEDNYGCDSKSPIATGTLDDSVKYFKIIKNGLAFYGKFLPFSLSDGRSTYSRNEVINSTQDGVTYIGIHLPQCQTCSIDPDFSLLIQGDREDCAKSGLKQWAIITIAVLVFIFEKKEETSNYWSMWQCKNSEKEKKVNLFNS